MKQSKSESCKIRYLSPKHWSEAAIALRDASIALRNAGDIARRVLINGKGHPAFDTVRWALDDLRKDVSALDVWAGSEGWAFNELDRIAEAVFVHAHAGHVAATMLVDDGEDATKFDRLRRLLDEVANEMVAVLDARKVQR